jgi:hypothetical protein
MRGNLAAEVIFRLEKQAANVVRAFMLDAQEDPVAALWVEMRSGKSADFSPQQFPVICANISQADPNWRPVMMPEESHTGMCAQLHDQNLTKVYDQAPYGVVVIEPPSNSVTACIRAGERL